MAHTQYRIVAGALGVFALFCHTPRTFAEAGNRPSGWSRWATFAISPAAPEPPPAATPTYHK
jgi:hypothetical protein